MQERVAVIFMGMPLPSDTGRGVIVLEGVTSKIDSYLLSGFLESCSAPCGSFFRAIVEIAIISSTSTSNSINTDSYPTTRPFNFNTRWLSSSTSRTLGLTWSWLPSVMMSSIWFLPRNYQISPLRHAHLLEKHREAPSTFLMFNHLIIIFKLFDWSIINPAIQEYGCSL